MNIYVYNYDLEKLLMHSGGRGLTFVDGMDCNGNAGIKGSGIKGSGAGYASGAGAGVGTCGGIGTGAGVGTAGVIKGGLL